MKWYHKILIAVTVILLSPLLLVALLVWGIHYLLELPNNKRIYYRSRYYQDLQLPFAISELHSPEFIFYNSAMERNLPVQYVRQDNALEYFTYNGTLYLFPGFDQIVYEDEKTSWQADFDGDWLPLDQTFQDMRASLRDYPEDMPIRLLVTRKMIALNDLAGYELPEYLSVIGRYETAFEKEEDPLKWRIPENTEDLYEMMQNTPALCGTYRLEGNGNIRWDLYEDFWVEIGVEPQDCFVGVNRKRGGGLEGFTHWHPTAFEIYETVLDLGTCGNILVLHRGLIATGVLYSGAPDRCPYSRDKKPLLSKRYFLETKR